MIEAVHAYCWLGEDRSHARPCTVENCEMKRKLEAVKAADATLSEAVTIACRGKVYDITPYQYIRWSAHRESDGTIVDEWIEGQTGTRWDDKQKSIVEVWERAPEV
jgi:hypothetical protein